MIIIALKMLISDRAKYLSISLGIAFACFLMMQQASMLTGIMERTYSSITDVSLPDIWVMDPNVRYVDDVKPMKDTALYTVKSVPGVSWAVPLFKGTQNARMTDGNNPAVQLIGVDDVSLIGGPTEMVDGSLADLFRSDSVIVDDQGAKSQLAVPLPDGTKRPLTIGDSIEMNDRRAIIVGFCKASKGFQSMPVIYTTYSRTKLYTPQQRKRLSFVLVKAAPGEDVEMLSRRIQERTGLLAVPAERFKEMTMSYFLEHTGILMNMGASVIFALIIGGTIAGQTFYNFTIENLRYFGTLKAMGADSRTLLLMVIMQALAAAMAGFGLGTGGISMYAFFSRGSEMSMNISVLQLSVTAVVVSIIMAVAAWFSLRRVLKLEPAVVFRS